MPTLGEILRSEREKKGLSIKDIEKATSIRSLYLNAIEEENYKVIPGEVYLKGFIRNYASYLGMNPQEMISLYSQAKTPAPAEPAESAKVAERADAPSSNTSEAQPGRIKWIAIGLVGVALAGSIWWFIGNRQSQPKPTQEVKPPTSTATPIPQATAPQQSQLAKEQSVASSKPVIVIAKYTDECWTLVIADGKEVYEGIPKKGETFTWEAQGNVSVQLGNAAGVEITYNGQALGKMGGKGEVVNKTFSANNKKQ